MAIVARVATLVRGIYIHVATARGVLSPERMGARGHAGDKVARRAAIIRRRVVVVLDRLEGHWMIELEGVRTGGHRSSSAHRIEQTRQ